MFTVKLKDILLAQKIINELSTKKLKFRALHAINTIIPDLIKNLEFIETNRLTLVDKYKDDTGNVDTNKLQEFELEFYELLDIDVEISGSKLNISDIENVEMSYIEYSSIKPFITE